MLYCDDRPPPTDYRRPTTHCVRLAIAIACSLAWATGAAAQWLYWETKISSGGIDRMTQNYAAPKMTKVVGGDGKAVIIRTDQDKVISLDTRKRKYQEMSFSDLESSSKMVQKQMEATRAQIERRMKEASPEQRAMMEKALPPKRPGTEGAKPLEVKKTGETKTIAGYNCVKYVATEGPKTVLATWTTNDIKGFEALREDWVAYQKRIAGTSQNFAGAMAEAYSKIEGFPMETEMGDVKTVVTKVESRPIPATEFEVPAGYKKEGLPPPPAAKPPK